jgi:hypothetical protein
MGRSMLRPYKSMPLAAVADLKTRYCEDKLTWRWRPARVERHGFR